jgi:hypothetical protein
MFKVGDKVRCTVDDQIASIMRGYIGTIIEVYDSYQDEHLYSVDFGDMVGSWQMHDYNLEEVE